MPKTTLTPRHHSGLQQIAPACAFVLPASISEHLYKLPSHRDERGATDRMQREPETMKNMERPSFASELSTERATHDATTPKPGAFNPPKSGCVETAILPKAVAFESGSGVITVITPPAEKQPEKVVTVTTSGAERTLSGRMVTPSRAPSRVTDALSRVTGNPVETQQ